jgi:membrane fusion protein (multidrug efflux system)
MSGGDFIVDEGLKGGELVIVNGLQKARPGAVVKPLPWSPGAPILGAPATAANAPVSPAKPNEEKK